MCDACGVCSVACWHFCRKAPLWFTHVSSPLIFKMYCRACKPCHTTCVPGFQQSTQGCGGSAHLGAVCQRSFAAAGTPLELFLLHPARRPMGCACWFVSWIFLLCLVARTLACVLCYAVCCAMLPLAHAIPAWCFARSVRGFGAAGVAGFRRNNNCGRWRHAHLP